MKSAELDGISDYKHTHLHLHLITLTLPGPSAGVSGSLDSYCSLKPLYSGMGEVVPARTSPALLPHPLALYSHYPVSKCRSASIVVTGTVRVNPKQHQTQICHTNEPQAISLFPLITQIKSSYFIISQLTINSFHHSRFYNSHC